MTEQTPATLPVRGIRALLRLVGYLLLGVAIAILCLWTTGALYYSNLPWPAVRSVMAIGFAVATVGAFVFLPRRRRTTVWFLAAFTVVVVWFWTISPSHDRDWAADVAVLPHATIDGQRVTITGIRNFQYRTETDFTPRYIERTYDLDKLATADFILSYWDGNRDIAHTLVTFGFESGEYLTLSVETRKQKGEGYSTTAGFFKQFELIYILAEERDVVGLRTNHRGEDVYLYPLVFTREQVRQLFHNVLDRVNEIHQRPAFYNALLHNCTTSLLPIANGVRKRPLVFDMRLILNGYIDQFGYEQGSIVADASQGLPYEEMRAKHRITDVARQIGDDPEYSKKIRAPLPARVR